MEALKRYNISIRENWELMNFECREQTQKDYNKNDIILESKNKTDLSKKSINEQFKCVG